MIKIQALIRRIQLCLTKTVSMGEIPCKDNETTVARIELTPLENLINLMLSD